MVREVVDPGNPSDNWVTAEDLLLQGGQAGSGHDLVAAQVLLHQAGQAGWRDPGTRPGIRVANKAEVRVGAARSSGSNLVLVDLLTGVVDHHRCGDNFAAGNQRSLADWSSVQSDPGNFAGLFADPVVGLLGVDVFEVLPEGLRAEVVVGALFDLF